MNVIAKFRGQVGRLTFAEVIDMAQKAGSVDDFESKARKFIPEAASLFSTRLTTVLGFKDMDLDLRASGGFLETPSSP